MNKISKIFAGLGMASMLFGLTSCNQDEIAVFDSNDAGIYFQDGVQTRFYLNIDAYNDSLNYSFSQAGDEVKDTIFSARIRTMGKVRDYDRKVRLVIDKEHTTGIEGVDFAVNFDTISIPAGKSEVMVPVKFFRTEKLKNEAVCVRVKLEPNENFIVPFTKQKNTNVYYSSGDTIKADSYSFVVSEFYEMPQLWGMFGDPVGEWSIKKQRLITEMFNLTAYDWSIDGWRNGDGKVLYKSFTYFAIKLRIYLQRMADEGTPVVDDNGEYMQLGSGYEVDYSKYEHDI